MVSRVRRLTLWGLFTVLLLSGCSREALHQQQIYIFGTLVDISIWNDDPRLASAAIDAIDRDFQRMHHEWHAWKPGPLVDLNRAFTEGRASEPVPSLLPLITESQQLYRDSDGLFNPAIGGLLALWGFQSDEMPSGPPPSQQAIAQWVEARPGMDDIVVEGGRVSSRNPAVQLDFGAFAKGYAVDRAIERLRGMGIENAIVNAGGDLRAIGRHGDRPWRVGIRHPQGEGVIAAIEAGEDESIFTSGNYERYRQYQEVRYPHILDPRDGMPVHHVASVTVIDAKGSVADAAATALVVAGPEQWYRIARQLGVRYVMLVDEEGTVYLNPAMRRRVEFQVQPERLVVSEPLFEGDLP